MRILSTVQPTKNQLTVLAIVAANRDKPLLATKMLANNQNLITARNLLMTWNALEFGNEKIGITDIGNKIALDNNIIDESGELTDIGKGLLPQDTQNMAPTMDNQTVDVPMDAAGPAMDAGVPPMEGFSPIFISALLRE